MFKILLFPFSLISINLIGQNLVPDPGFEIHNADCTDNPPGLTHWFNPNTATPDLWCMGECGDNIPDTFGEIYECPLPVEGGCYAGLYTATTNATINHTREYFSCELVSELVADQLYRVAFKAYRYENFGLAIDKLGVAFTSSAPFFDTFMNIPLEPQVESEGVILQADSSYWQQMEFYFTAEGGERYLTIGNFRVPSDMQITDTGTGKFDNRAYHFFDEVTVENSTSISEQQDEPAFLVRLRNGVLTIAGSVPGQYAVFDLSGRQLLHGSVQSGENSKDLAFLPRGLYLVRVSDGHVVENVKIWKE